MRVPGFGQTYPIEFLDTNKLAGERNTSVLVDLGFGICSISMHFFVERYRNAKRFHESNDVYV